MKRLQAFPLQLRPYGQQERERRCVAGACRFVFSRAFAIQQRNDEEGNRDLPDLKVASWLIVIVKEWQGDNARFRDPQSVKLDQENNRTSLPKLGWMRRRACRKGWVR